MNVKNIPIITDRDKKLFYYLNIFKYLDVKFIHKHIYNHRSKWYVYKRLQQLEYHNYLNTIKMYEINTKSDSTVPRSIYINGENAKEFLDFNLATNSRIADFHEHYIRHQIALANGMVSYDNADLNIEGTEIRIVKLLSEQELSISDKKISVRPDAGFILEISKANILYFVEMERSYAKEDDLMRKLVDQYSNITKYVNRLEAIEYYGIQTIRLLFISEDNNKMKNIIYKTQKVAENKMEILFTSLPLIEDHMKSDNNILNMDYETVTGNVAKLYGKIR